MQTIGEVEEEGKGGQIRATLLSNRATTLLKLGRHEEALVDTEASLVLLPTSFKALRTRARIYLHLEIYDTAIADFKSAIQQAETEGNSTENDVRALQSELEKAEAALKRSTRTAGGGSNLYHKIFNVPQPTTLSRNNTPRPPPTQADRAALACLQKYPHHPDTEAGRKAHQAQQVDWAKTHGPNALVTESTPYPLRPGTQPVASGECFTCGFLGHLGRRDGSTCGGNRALHPHEQKWRSICSRILKQTRNRANVPVDDYGTTWPDV